MKNLVKELIKENKNILHTYPNIKDNLRTSAGHRYMFNKEMISKLELLIIANVSQHRELLKFFIETQASELFKTETGFKWREDMIEETIKNFNRG